jgi:hypothetical protein
MNPRDTRPVRLRQSLLVLAAVLSLAIAAPTGASAADTVTYPAGQSLSFGPLKVKGGYSLSGFVTKHGSDIQFDVTIGKGEQTVTVQGDKGISLKLAKGLASGQLKASLGSKYGKITFNFKPTGKVKNGSLAKKCTGKKPTSRAGNVTGSLSLKLGDSYFKTIKASKLKATASDTPASTCPAPSSNPGTGSDKQPVSLSGGNKVSVFATKNKDGTVDESVSTNDATGPTGTFIQHSIFRTVPGSLFTNTADAKSAHLKGSGSSLSGTLDYAATEFYAGGSGGKLSGDFTVKFVGLATMKPFAAGTETGNLVVPGFKPPNQSPIAAFSTSQDAGKTDIAFEGADSEDPDGNVTGYTWDFGDGSPVSHELAPIHHYATAGQKSVTLTVTDNQGATGSTTKPVTVNPDSPPVANFDYSQDDPSTTEITFSDGSNDSDGVVVGYTWDFGDGTPVSHDQAPVHNYATPGQKSVTLTVTDNGGATGTITKQVTVADPIP